MGYERNKPNTVEKLEIIIGAAQRKYLTIDEGAALYGFDKFAKGAGARRKIRKRF